jgi:magnesium chelatase subunit D
MTARETVSPIWTDACLAAALFAVDPAGLGGIVVRAAAGPVRDRFLGMSRALWPAEAPARRVPLAIEDERLLGGLDLSASLAAGRPIAQRGVLAETDGGVAILAMAERLETAAAARIAAVLDSGEVAIERDGLTERRPARVGVIALDEGATPEERAPAALRERLAFHLDLSELGARAPLDRAHDPETVAEARAALSAMPPAPYAVVEGLCAAAGLYGLGSARSPLLALRAARAHAALEGRTEITADDAAAGARLVYGPRALTTAPADAPPPSEPSPTESEASPDPSTSELTPPADSPPSDSPPSPEEAAAAVEQVIAAIQAALPADLLARAELQALVRARDGGRGAGASAKAARRGRPVGVRQGALRSGDRLNLVETLRAATPWQKLRNNGAVATRLQVRREDFRIRRFEQRAESTTIFVVDASGSAAFQRLAEAKGAVELLLAKAYVSRTRVALIAFRGQAAELLLAPTRSLTRAKRQLADLPGGGGTPLASALDAALELARGEAAQNRSPLLVLLTDGRANIGRDGAPGRPRAEADALSAAQRIGEARVASVFIDTSARPQPDGDRFARAMRGVYAPLPYADAERVYGLVDDFRPMRR